MNDAAGKLGVDPSTVEGKLVASLVNNGLWPEEATEVIAGFKELEVQAPMQGRWAEPADGYPEMLYSVLWMSLREHTLDWLNENKPMHFAKPMFDPSHPIHQQALDQ